MSRYDWLATSLLMTSSSFVDHWRTGLGDGLLLIGNARPQSEQIVPNRSPGASDTITRSTRSRSELFGTLLEVSNHSSRSRYRLTQFIPMIRMLVLTFPMLFSNPRSAYPKPCSPWRAAGERFRSSTLLIPKMFNHRCR